MTKQSPSLEGSSGEKDQKSTPPTNSVAQTETALAKDQPTPIRAVRDSFSQTVDQVKTGVRAVSNRVGRRFDSFGEEVADLRMRIKRNPFMVKFSEYSERAIAAVADYAIWTGTMVVYCIVGVILIAFEGVRFVAQSIIRAALFIGAFTWAVAQSVWNLISDLFGWAKGHIVVGYGHIHENWLKRKDGASAPAALPQAV